MQLSLLLLGLHAHFILKLYYEKSNIQKDVFGSLISYLKFSTILSLYSVMRDFNEKCYGISKKNLV